MSLIEDHFKLHTPPFPQEDATEREIQSFFQAVRPAEA